MDPIVGLLLAASFAVGLVVEFRRRMKRSGELRLELPPGEAPPVEAVHGFTVTHERQHMGLREPVGSQGNTIDLWRNTTTIRRALPEWVAFGWTVDAQGVRPDSRNGLWVDLVFGRYPDLPDGGIVYASRGDLVYDSMVDDAPPPSRGLVGAAGRFLRDLPDITSALERYVEGGPPGAAVAFRILARACPDKRVAERLAARYRDSQDADLFAEIAAFELPSSRDRIVERVNAGGPASARAVMIEGLIERADGEGLAAIAPEHVPPGSAAAFLEGLRAARRPEGEGAALHFLDAGTDTRAAIDTLAALGGRASIARLLELQAAGLDRDGELGLEVTIELVRARIAAEVGDGRGGLALASGDAGDLSIADGGGGLAVTGDD